MIVNLSTILIFSRSMTYLFTLALNKFRSGKTEGGNDFHSLLSGSYVNYRLCRYLITTDIIEAASLDHSTIIVIK